MKLCKVSKKIGEAVLLLEKRPMSRKELMAKDFGAGTVKKIVDWLIEKGFAVEVPVSRFKTEIRLTEKGMELAKRIRELEELVGDP